MVQNFSQEASFVISTFKGNCKQTLGIFLFLIQMESQFQLHIHSFSLTFSRSLSLSVKHTHTLTHARTHTRTHTLSQSNMHTHTHTRTQNYAHRHPPFSFTDPLQRDSHILSHPFLSVSSLSLPYRPTPQHTLISSSLVCPY